jgi:hypothetical protein
VQAVIPVSASVARSLLTCGGQDLVWPSCGYVDAITARLRAHRFADPVTVLLYREAGHLVGGLTAYYGSPTDDALTSSGGTVAGAQAAQADAHAKLLAFARVAVARSYDAIGGATNPPTWRSMWRTI